MSDAKRMNDSGRSKLPWCLTSTETMGLIRDGKKEGMGMEVGGEGDYIPISIATLSPPE